MSETEEYLSKNTLIVMAITSVIVLILGIVLIVVGLNEAFYVKDPIIQTIFEVITFMGEPIFFIVLIAIFFYTYDKKFAKNFAFSLLTSTYINGVLKEIFQDPRPAGNVAKGDHVETSYGFPSGHTQSAVSTWGYVGYHFKDKPKPLLVPIICAILITLIGLSRLILGVHDVQDVVGGFLIGLGCLVAFIYLEPRISEKISPLSLGVKIGIAIAVSLLLFIVGTLLFPYAGAGLVKDPQIYGDEGAFAQVGGAILGISVGYLLEGEYVKYEPSELNSKQKIINGAIGLLILIVSYFALDMIISGTVVHRFIRYALVSFIAVLIVPLLFTKINKK